MHFPFFPKIHFFSKCCSFYTYDFLRPYFTPVPHDRPYKSDFLEFLNLKRKQLIKEKDFSFNIVVNGEIENCKYDGNS